MLIDITTGSNHNIVLSDDGRVYVFGTNYYGQCGRTSKEYYDIPGENTTLRRLGDKIVEVGCGDWHSCCKNENGEWFIWGWDQYNECLTYNNLGAQLTPNCINGTVAEYIGDDWEIVSMQLGSAMTTLVIRKK